MFSFLKNHPFAVEAFFESTLVLAFAVPREEIAALLPECLEPDVFDDKWAFVAMALVQTQGLRPKGFPRITGHDFFLIGYRVFVRYTNSSGKRLRGLYILKSETDKYSMELLGNIFTKYSYTTTDISRTERPGETIIRSVKSGFEIVLEPTGENEAALPPGSPFKDWKEARRFAGPLPFTFSYDAASGKVLIVEGVREAWKPTPVSIKHYEISFLQSLGLSQCHLANAFILRNIPYHWKKGRTEIWTGKDEPFRE